MDVEEENLISDSHTFDEFENLGELGEPNDPVIPKGSENKSKRKRNTTYNKEKTTEIDKILQTKNIRSNLNTTFINGNITTPLNVAPHRYFVINTCPLYALAEIRTLGYTDITIYKIFIDSSVNNRLKFCKSLAKARLYKYGPKQNTHIYLLELLKLISDKSLIYGEHNLSFAAFELFKNSPSAIKELQCKTDGCFNSNDDLECTTIPLTYSNLNNLQKYLDFYRMRKVIFKKCDYCSKLLTSKITVKNHLLFDLIEPIGFPKIIPLSKFPIQLEANNVKYV